MDASFWYQASLAPVSKMTVGAQPTDKVGLMHQKAESLWKADVARYEKSIVVFTNVNCRAASNVQSKQGFRHHHLEEWYRHRQGLGSHAPDSRGSPSYVYILAPALDSRNGKKEE